MNELPLYSLFYAAFGPDPHRRAAAWIFHKPEAAVTDEERGVGKRANFILAYGAAPKVALERLGLPEGAFMALDYIRNALLANAVTEAGENLINGRTLGEARLRVLVLAHVIETAVQELDALSKGAASMPLRDLIAELQTVLDPSAELTKLEPDPQAPCPTCGGTRFLREYPSHINCPACNPEP